MSAARVLGDWGGTNLRLFRVQDGVVTARLDGPGTTALSGNAAEVLAERLALWLAEGPIAGVTLCGMAGSPAGLVVAPYAPCPATAAQWQAAPATLTVAGVPVAVLPGLSARDAKGVPDVMRGEEAQVFGAMALDPALAHGRHVIVLPGTHSKWVMLDDGAITGFRTAPTGELYALIAGQSSLTGNDAPGEGSFDDGFARGLARADEPMPGALFEARAARLLDGRSRAWAQGYLSGLLIGAEVAQFAPDTGSVVVVGAPALAALYARALTARGLAFTAVDGDAAVLAGLTLTLQESSQP
ncbi:2-dehydro-3-deoxygalactonokinase [Novosphingobium percolationis]|uniref:2-dehydro-3-deoxygalactonokinase n=1 Tax=Novosphingobium percolationis TaxID=2871811 RepID=UPI001CD1BB73|nr:2-dehydro-3-deoxygalactonokinase [Novosphingobium percolationis]